MKRIAVIGATGMLGLPVVGALVAAGFEVTALVRKPDAAAKVLPAGVRIIAADVRDEESLRRGLAGQDGLYLNLAVDPAARACDFHTEREGLALILAAAAATGIKRIGYVSALVHDSDERWWVLDLWRAALQRLKSSPIPSTVFYLANVMETLAQRHLTGGFFVMTGGALYPNYWIAGADFGAQVARALADEGRENREYVIQGPEPMTYREAAERFAAAKGLRVVTVPLVALAALGLVSRRLAFHARMMRVVLSYPEEFKAAPTWDALGRPTTTLEDFAQRA